jgi:hypothetical protein
LCSRRPCWPRVPLRPPQAHEVVRRARTFREWRPRR